VSVQEIKYQSLYSVGPGGNPKNNLVTSNSAGLMATWKKLGPCRRTNEAEKSELSISIIILQLFIKNNSSPEEYPLLSWKMHYHYTKRVTIVVILYQHIIFDKCSILVLTQLIRRDVLEVYFIK